MSDLQVFHEIGEPAMRLVPIDAVLIERLRALIAGVEVDLNQPLPHEVDDAGMP